jgi:hypothetical protein
MWAPRPTSLTPSCVAASVASSTSQAMKTKDTACARMPGTAAVDEPTPGAASRAGIQARTAVWTRRAGSVRTSHAGCGRPTRHGFSTSRVRTRQMADARCRSGCHRGPTTRPAGSTPTRYSSKRLSGASRSPPPSGRSRWSAPERSSYHERRRRQAEHPDPNWAVRDHIGDPLDPNEYLGSSVLELSAHSDLLQQSDGGHGTVGIHGRGGGSLLDPIGSPASHGCIRPAIPGSWILPTVATSQSIASLPGSNRLTGQIQDPAHSDSPAPGTPRRRQSGGDPESPSWHQSRNDRAPTVSSRPRGC